MLSHAARQAWVTVLWSRKKKGFIYGCRRNLCPAFRLAAVTTLILLSLVLLMASMLKFGWCPPGIFLGSAEVWSAAVRAAVLSVASLAKTWARRGCKRFSSGPCSGTLIDVTTILVPYHQ